MNLAQYLKEKFKKPNVEKELNLEIAIEDSTLNMLNSHNNFHMKPNYEYLFYKHGSLNINLCTHTLDIEGYVEKWVKITKDFWENKGFKVELFQNKCEHSDGDFYDITIQLQLQKEAEVEL